ncbi:MAG: RagB/SusD family nutrient uptake outer membrane protein [Gemmatimonadaceae bacterium]
MKKFTLPLTATLVLASACIDSTIVSPENAATVDALAGALTRGGVTTLALGVLAADRAFVRGDFTYYQGTAILARDAYRIEATESRYVVETLTGPADPGSFAGSGGWTNGYVAARAANSLLEALPAVDVQQLSVAERNVTAGLVQTIKALDYYRLLELRDTLGVAIQTKDAAEVPPISCKATVLTYIVGQLDSANAALTAAGATTKLPFAPPTGLTAFGRSYQTADNLIKLNRGLRGKVSVYRGLQRPTPVAGAFTDAIANLTQALGGAAPGAVPASTFGSGAFVTFVAGGTENAPNPIPLASVGANPKAVAALQAGDTRASKFVTRSNLSGNGVATTMTFVFATTSNAANQSRPLPILRDEEVVLLRAQAYFEAGQFANGAADLNSVRTTYGLAAIPVPADLATARAALLYEKRYSLLFEGPQRLVDLRAYGQLKAGITTPEGPTDPFNTAFPIPKGEGDARGGRDKLTPVCS